MSIETDVFQRRTLLPERLIPFGFRTTNGGYFYSQPILDGQFAVELRIDQSAHLSTRVVDLATDEEYAPVKVEMSTGAFVGAVREAYRAVLQAVAEACYRTEYFSAPQSNRIAQALYERYGERPDFPFATAPTYGVFRYPPNRKWYGIIMDVPLFRVTKEAPETPEDSPVADVLNLKIDVVERDRLLRRKGIYTCYHMNKDSWVSIVLDDTLPDRDVLTLLDVSRTLIMRAKR